MYIQKMKRETMLINRVYAPIKVSGCMKYGHNQLNIVGCKAVARAGRTPADGRTDRRTDRRRKAQQHPTVRMGQG